MSSEIDRILTLKSKPYTELLNCPSSYVILRCQCDSVNRFLVQLDTTLQVYPTKYCGYRA